MRVNVYGEELTDRIELVTKDVQEESMGENFTFHERFTFYGLRFWLKFPNQPWWIHRKIDGEEDDDSSAVTIWADSKEALESILQQGIAELQNHGSDL